MTNYQPNRYMRHSFNSHLLPASSTKYYNFKNVCTQLGPCLSWFTVVQGLADLNPSNDRIAQLFLSDSHSWVSSSFGVSCCFIKKIFFNFFNVYSFLRHRETECKQGRAGGEGYTESEAGSRLWAVSTEPSMGLKLTNHEIMTWAKVGGLTDWATQVPLLLLHFDHPCLIVLLTPTYLLKVTLPH